MHTWLAYEVPLVLISDNDISLHTKAEIPREFISASSCLNDQNIAYIKKVIETDH